MPEVPGTSRTALFSSALCLKLVVVNGHPRSRKTHWEACFKSEHFNGTVLKQQFAA